ncbi:serine hydrolase domain-containing protein [Microbispora sp. H10885]|uniref:serine hydrolase domain-containing protein n=1 Tax=Microbispora sp. H10885 TaxID=2729110 RepID=UPI001601D2B6|nr:serine hydrolase domain-containing protein [Microbispora sp. H10885]
MIGVLARPHILTFLETRLRELVRAHGVCGAQLAVHQDGETVAIEVGELEHGGGTPVTRDAAFPIGSVTKPFTATLAMTLVADGDLDLDEPLGRHLPELDELGDRLTLRHLLSHTAGFACGPDSTEVSTASPRRYVADHCQPHNLVQPPGAGFSYSNMGYVAVGRLVEVITGMSWAEALEAFVLRPLGIRPAFICRTEVPPSGRPVATGHSVNPALRRTQPVRQSIAPPEAPAGALAASAADLVALGRLHVGAGIPGLLPGSYAERMRQPVLCADPYGLADGWGLGLAVYGGETGDWVGHDGNADGTSCYLRIDPVDGWIVALTTNTGTGIGLWKDLGRHLAEAGVPMPTGESPAGSRPGAPPRDCAGAYRNGDAEYLVTRSGGGLTLTVDGSGFAVLTGADGLTFELLDHSSGQRLPGGRFQRDPRTGEINGILVNGRLAGRCHAAVMAR